MERFFRLQRLLGNEAFARIQSASVLVVGLGAVGSYAAEALARAGIGSMTIADFDKISITNINRQLYALESTIGMLKADVAEQRIRDINPAIKIRKVTEFIDNKNVGELLAAEKYAAVIDAIDSLQPKIDLLASAWQAGLRVYSSMGAALRTDPSQIKTADIMDTLDCPLARRVRKGLREQGVGRGIRCVYSPGRKGFQFLSPEQEEVKEELPPEAANRRLLGSMPTITGIFGLTLANMVIMDIAGLSSGD
ncbi:MAG: tRNA threonylcarbamoyladenosine dehydratase [Spirochaetales bacterium]|nr:tRNA threonylcarbamoyladenosine dehydratase [Spirochaetales bacterium]